MINKISARLAQSFPNTIIQEIPEFNALIGSTIGTVREENQDTVVAGTISVNREDPSLGFAIIADGMGGMKKGRHAAVMATASFLDSVFSSYKNGERNLSLILVDAIESCNRSVFDDLSGEGGSTFSVVVQDESCTKYANIGDSRIYQISNKKLNLLTTDDNVENMLKNEKNISLDSTMINKNGLTKFIGQGDLIEPEIRDIDGTGKLFLTTDGLHSVGDELLSSLYKYSLNEKEFSQRCLHLSRWIGGKDNATFALVSLPIIKVIGGNQAETNQARMDLCDLNGLFRIEVNTLVEAQPKRVKRKNIKKEKSSSKATDSEIKYSKE